MAKPEAPYLLHEDQVLFREAVNFTASQTGFIPRLIEKDYFCTLALRFLRHADAGLVFKGGTCLAKVHAGFYRLSEDLDFVIPTPIDATRLQRSRGVARLKKALAAAGARLKAFRLVAPLAGANKSAQYAAVLGYASLLEAREETIEIEVGLREPLLERVTEGAAKTLLLDPVTGVPAVPVTEVPVISWREAVAEKVRAALTRREVAIRDYYDIHHAVHRLNFDMKDPKFAGLVRKKLAVPGNGPIDVSPERLAELKLQLEARLKPVLRTQDFGQFDLPRAFQIVSEIAAISGAAS
jgi:hypothetical protein